jgi:SPP1 family predicted phage head-tail adaptor
MSETPTIGQMYQSVKFQYYTLDKKANGEEAPLWTDYKTTKAAVNTTSTGEREENNRLAVIENLDIDIRTITGLNTKMRIIYNNKIYQITGVIQTTRRYQKIKAILSLDWTDEYLTSQQPPPTVDSETINTDQVYI